MTDHTETINRLDRLIHRLVPGVVSISKYGGTLYTLRPDEKEGQFCGVFAYTKHVQLSFSRGTSLADPSGILAGTGKYRRHINFAEAAHVDDTELTGFILEAARL